MKKLYPILFTLHLSFLPLALMANDKTNAADSISLHSNMDELVVVSTPKEHTSLHKQPISFTALGNAQLKQKASTTSKT